MAFKRDQAESAFALTALPEPGGGSGPAAWVRSVFSGVRELVQPRSRPILEARPEFAEAFRLLALELISRQTPGPDAHPVKTVAVLGAYRGEGRTLTVAGLAAALAELGHKAIAVETDRRQSGLAWLLGVSPNAARVSASGCLETRVSDLLLLPRAVAGNWLENAETVRKLVAMLRQQADYVIFDSPPCLQYSDAFLLAAAVDGVMFVVGRRQQDAEQQRVIQARLARLGANTLGLVYNSRV